MQKVSSGIGLVESAGDEDRIWGQKLKLERAGSG